MPCPFHDGTDDGSETTDDAEATAGAGGGPSDRDRGLDRREFMKSALAIGGASALSTAIGLYGMPEAAAADGDPIGVAVRSNRQHAWDGFETNVSEGGVSAHPSHHVTLHLDYANGGTPTPDERTDVEEALREIERHFEWSSEGVLFTIGYAPAYFDRFDEDLPKGLSPKGKVVKPGLLRPQDLIDTAGVTLEFEDPTADEAEVCLHLASNNAQNILAVEQLLWGNEVGIDGENVTFDSTFDGILTSAGSGDGRPTEFPHRRVGFSGHENISANLEEDTEFDPDRIPDDAELMMGFNDLYRNSIPRETNATMLEDQQLVEPHPPGQFAQGTIQHVSKLDIDLDRFYDRNDEQRRRELMFSPDHDEGNTGEVGENLGNSNAPGETPMRDLDGETDDKAEQVPEDFEEEGAVGHAQKLARARFNLETRLTDEGQARLSGGDRDELLPAEEREDDLPGHDGDQEAEQVILRRDVTSTDQNTPGNLFVSVMRFNPYMAYIRQAMNGVAFDSANFGLTGENRIDDEAVGAGPDSGIVNYLETKRRGNYLVPPITVRALPYPQDDEIDDITVERAGENYQVTVSGTAAGELENGSVRFGWFYDVNRGGGASPRQARQRGNRTTYVFPADETGIGSAPGGPDGDVRVRLFAKRADTGRPVRGTARVDPEGARGNEAAGRESDGRGR